MLLTLKITSRFFILWASFAILLAACQSQAQTPVEPALPTPIGYPDSAQDVGTLVGKPAPTFTLNDETEQAITVNPGETGRPVVLIFNMGLG